ncbi:MAG TPA: hypothetical protein VFS43_25115 [Polyangiaceae bacterium]|nr:hypothetical protein [Polyangiaceae bacterium]
MRAGALTVVAPVRPERLEALRGLLREVGGRADASPLVPFRDVPSLHFARWALVPPAAPGAPTLLAFESNFDGPAAAHLGALVGALGADFGRVYGHCAGFDEGAPRPHEALARYLRRHALDEAAFYVGARALTRALIDNDLQVRRALDRRADELVRRGLAPRDPQAVRAELLAALEAQRGLALGPPPAPPAGPPPRALVAAALVACGAALVPALPVLAPGALALALALRWHERRDAAALPAEPPPDDDERLDEVVRREDAHAQNPLTHLATIKAGPLRAAAVRAALAAIDLLGRYHYTQGRLGEVASIHFARWAILPDRRLLFFSNYDGSWESYLGDFVDKQSKGLSAIWSNTEGFPATRWLLLDGAADEERFKLWVRRHQVPTQVWFSAYPSLSLADVLRNARLRAGARAAPAGAAADARAWLAEL